MASEKDAQERPNSRQNTSLSGRVHQKAAHLFDGMISKYLESETKGKVVDYLKEFLSVNSNCKDRGGSCRAVFNVVAQSASGQPKEEVLLGHEKLEQYIRDYVSSGKNGALSFCALIAENICPYSICLLGTELHVKPGFWATHFEKSYLTQWEDVDPWLLPLPSEEEREIDRDLLNIQYVEPRELVEVPSPLTELETIQVVPRPLDFYKNYLPNVSAKKSYKQRVNREVLTFPVRKRSRIQRAEEEQAEFPVALIPGPLSVWRKQSLEYTGGTDIMVILIDPKPHRLNMKGNYHLDGKITDVPKRPSERISYGLLKSYGKEGTVAENAYDSIGKMISKQWRLVHGYMSRDLHLIQRKLEIIPDFDVAEKLLEDLFRHREKCAQYERQVEDTAEEFRERSGAFHSAILELEYIRTGFSQLSKMTERNIDLLTDLTAIKEAQQSLDENHGVTRLTQIATIYLPFSTIAAVLSMPDHFAPGESQFWVYWVSSAMLAAIVVAVVMTYKRLKSLWVGVQKRWKDIRLQNDKLGKPGEDFYI